MEQLFCYGNVIFWIGLLVVIFLAGCEFLFNDMNKTLADYRKFSFPKHPRLQKVCRALFLISFCLIFWAKVGVNWSSRTYDIFDYFTNFMVILIIYYVVCYCLVIVLLYGLKILWMILRLAISAVYWIGKEAIEWINGE